jgi:hypothetical protein
VHGAGARALVFILIAALAGCGNLQHNDVLVFATDTKLALDVSPSPTSGGAPSFTLGYKRSEGVWMPLVINGTHSTVLNGQKVCDQAGRCWSYNYAALEAFKICAAKEDGPPVACLRSLSQDIKYTGSGEGRTDTYSVFASFGADTGASGGGKATLAQFFATGVAAQKLANNPNVEKALIAKEATAEQVDAANAAADEAKAERNAALRKAGVPLIDPVATSDSGTVDAAIACWRDHRADYRAKAAEMLGDSHQDLVSILKNENEAEVIGGLRLHGPDASALAPVTQAVCTAGG